MENTSMAIKNLIPWNNKGREVGFQLATSVHSFLELHREMNRMFDDVFRGSDVAPFGLASRILDGLGWPQIDIEETDKEVPFTAELPDLNQNDVSWKSRMAFFRSRVRAFRSMERPDDGSRHYLQAVEMPGGGQGREERSGMRQIMLAAACKHEDAVSWKIFSYLDPRTACADDVKLNSERCHGTGIAAATSQRHHCRCPWHHFARRHFGLALSPFRLPQCFALSYYGKNTVA